MFLFKFSYLVQDKVRPVPCREENRYVETITNIVIPWERSDVPPGKARGTMDAYFA